MDKIKIENFPYEIEIVNYEDNQDLKNYLQPFMDDFVFIGPKKYILPKRYLSGAAKVYNFQLSSLDTFVVTYPKSGTTLVQELVWLIENNLDFEKAQSMTLTARFPFLESSILYDVSTFPITEEQKKKMIKSQMPVTIDDMIEMPSPRFIKSHLALSLLPPALLDTVKVVYVIRDPRDVAYSFYKFQNFFNTLSHDLKFKKYWNFFISNYVMWSPYFEHILEAWEKRNHPNLLLLFYEDIVKDLMGTVRRVADFYGKTLTVDQINRLVDHLDIKNFKNNKSVNMEEMKESGICRSDGAFIRKGKPGGWRDHFDDEMTAEADKWIKENLRNTDFRFPHFN